MAVTKAKRKKKSSKKPTLSFEEFAKTVIDDYRLACVSREMSLLGRKEVLTGKAKFGIFGDGKEIAQIAMAKAFQNGDFRSGYYRDQTFMLATGMLTVEQFFAQLYANPDLEAEPASGGRQMNGHFATRSLDEDGNWKNLLKQKNSAADSSPTASQMSRAVGLALASKQYRNIKGIKGAKSFSDNGNEVTFATIGDASTSEGVFWEAFNAAGVMKIPLAFSVWDDGYGISVPREFQTTKGNISEILEGFRVNKKGEGYNIYTAKAWDYPALCEMYANGIADMRITHIPALFHVTDVTQPQGHSTSGSHERYKSKERLQWETDFDGIEKMKAWMIKTKIADKKTLDAIREDVKAEVKEEQKNALNAYYGDLKSKTLEAVDLINNLSKVSDNAEILTNIGNELKNTIEPIRKDIIKAVKKSLRNTIGESSDAREQLKSWLDTLLAEAKDKYNSHLYSESNDACLNIAIEYPEYADDAPIINGFEVLNACFDAALKRDKRICVFGEDVGKIGDVNQGLSGMQEKYGIDRVFDTGIRENTIIGQGIGMAMRGLRPIAEIQYLDYLLYGLQPLSDDLATLQYRTKGGQKAPLIVRTRGHRLEGIWHTGSPIGMILGALRGMQVLVPRNMTQAAGFYNLMLQSDEPALIIECLNGYRLKEKLPSNIDTFTVPLGVPEVLQEGDDITIVTYGSSVRIAEEAVKQLAEVNISCELIDVQSLLPFDINHSIVESIKKTNKVLFLDEDVPGGGTAYMMQKVLEEQEAYYHLDAKPISLSAHAHRAAYGTDGDYFSKPNAEDVFEVIYDLMNEYEPGVYVR